MSTNTVRLQDLSDIAARSREAIRNIQKGGSAPWNDAEEFKGTAHRRYSGYHALALVLAEMLMAQEMSVGSAGMFVREHEAIIRNFLDEVTAGAEVTPCFVLGVRRCVDDELFDRPMWMSVPGACGGTLEEVSARIISELHLVGTYMVEFGDKRKDRVIAGPNIATASIPEAYRLLQTRARSAGFEVSGWDIIKAETAAASSS